MNDLVIIGAGGLAREVAFLVDEINRANNKPLWNLLGFVAKNRSDPSEGTGRYPVAFGEEELINLGKPIHVVIGIGAPEIIRAVAAKLDSCTDMQFPNLIHPNVVMDHERIPLGKGNIICAGNVLTTDIVVGSFNYFNNNCSTGHDTVVGDYCVFNPGVNISGGVTFGDGCLVGTGADVLQNLRVGGNSTIGAGAVVVRDVAPGTVVAGVPARELPRKDAPAR